MTALRVRPDSAGMAMALSCDSSTAAGAVRALRAALVGFYPQLKQVTLTDYKVRILESSTGTEER